MSKRSDILSAVDTVIRSVSGIGDVFVGKVREIFIDEVNLPAAFADFSGDRPAEGGMGFEAFVVQVDVEVWCPDSSRETLLAAVHAGMISDVTLGGAALNVTRTTCKTLFVDAGRSLSGFILSFDILYRHPRGTP